MSRFIDNGTLNPLNFYLSQNEEDKVNYPKLKMLNFDNDF